MKNVWSITNVVIIFLQTHVKLYMSVTWHNIGKKIKQQNLTSKFNCLIADVIYELPSQFIIDLQ